MKKNFVYALLSAIALAGGVGFSSCSSTDDSAEVNPNYNPNTGEVLTQFVFNVSNGNQPTTRQSADATQASSSLEASKFRGIENAHILCFKNTAGDGKYITSPTTAEKDFDMARVLNAGTIANDMSRRVLEMSLPLNTNSMVFYGRAVKETDKNAYGDLENSDGTDGYNVSDNLANVSFHLSKCLKSDDKTKFVATQKLLAGILTCIMNTNRGDAAVAATETAGNTAYGFAIASDVAANMPWSDYVDASTGQLKEKSPVDVNVNLTELERKLAKVYKEMTQIQTAELRNTSGPALLATIKNLWSIVNSVRCATPTSLPEAVAKYMASRISAEIHQYFDYTTLPVDGGSVDGVAFKEGGVSVLITNFSSDPYWPSGAGDKPGSTTFNDISSVTVAELATFPENYNLPQGSTHITFDKGTKVFSYAVNYNTSAVGSTAFTVDDYYYPPELLYFGNSPLRVSDAEHVVSQYPASTTLWDTEASTNTTDSWYGWTANSHVQSTTRSVAMRNDINYGTSLLKTTVGYTSNIQNGTKLQDNNKFIQDRDYSVTEDNKQIAPNATSFILKGILIGGQYPRVGWNFLPSLADGERQGYVFDKAITSSGSIPVSGSSEPNYTLVFDNYTTATTQDKVYVALELMNNSGEDFFGKDNLIPNGSNFYLIGELDPTGKPISSWPSYHALPPYPYDSSNGSTVRVFIQDYMTEANFKIGEYSLQYAYLTVPDLRSSSVTLGLSVDVKWSTGLEFDDVIVGGDSQITVPTNP